eukprot:4976775-Amphidinium_carterae.2
MSVIRKLLDALDSLRKVGRMTSTLYGGEGATSVSPPTASVEEGLAAAPSRPSPGALAGASLDTLTSPTGVE